MSSITVKCMCTKQPIKMSSYVLADERPDDSGCLTEGQTAEHHPEDLADEAVLQSGEAVLAGPSEVGGA